MRPLSLVGGCLAFWLLLVLPARALGAPDGTLLGTLALVVLCLVPAAITLLIADRFADGSAERRLLIVLGSTGFRMFFVLGVAWALHANVPFFQEVRGYWMWLIVFYLATLALEISLLLTGAARADRQANTNGPEVPAAEASAPPPVMNGR